MANDFPLPPSPLPSPPPPPPPPPSEDLLPPLPGGETLPPPEENPVIPSSYEPPQPIIQAPISRSPFRLLVPLAIGLVVIGLIIFVISRIFSALKPVSSKTPTQQAITLNYWGLWETPAIMKPVIAAFEAANPGIKINYQLQSYQDYQDRFQTAINGKNPPDIARIHSTWLPVFIRNLIPSPANTISLTEIQTNFYPFVANSVIVNNQVYGVPLTFDGLMLYLNTNILKQKNLSAPKTWEDLKQIAIALTDRDLTTGKINRAGVALGNTANVRGWPDIVSLMLIQGGVNLLNPLTKPTAETLTYYTSFAGLGKYWDETMPDSVVAFANEKVAAIFAPLWVIPEIQAINPGLTWQTAALPQLPDSDPVSWITMWMEVVPKNSPHPQEAWKFISYLASAKAQQLLFESAVKERGMSQVPTNKAVGTLAAQNPLTAPLVAAADKGKTFYTASLTRDSSTGLNSRLIKYLEDAVNTIAAKQDSTKAVDTMNLGFNQVLSEFRLVTPLPTITTSP